MNMNMPSIHPFGFMLDSAPVPDVTGDLLMAELPGLVGPCRVEGVMCGSCAGIAYDSRRVRPGMVFAALPGTRVDGRTFIPDAIARGAAAILQADGSDGAAWPIPVLRVPHPRRAMGRIAAAFCRHPSLTLQVVGVTGTNGKTSVAWLTRHMLERAGHRSGLIGTVQHDAGDRPEPAVRTTPEGPDLHELMARMVRNGCRHAVMEVSSHALDQERTAGIEFDVAVFTNLTPDHLDYHGTMEAYFEAKARLFAVNGEPYAGVARVVNVDDPWGARLARLANGDVLSYGLSVDAYVRAADVQLGPRGTRFTCVTPWGEAPVQLPLIGRFNVYNALAALAAGGALSLPLDVMVHALAEHPAVPGRFERIEPTDRRPAAGSDADRPLVFVDYAHTEDALDQVLRTLRPLAGGRLICVFGCGGDRDRSKRPRMGAKAAAWADLTVITSDNPRSEVPERIIADIRAGCPPHARVWTIPDRREAIAAALRSARGRDIVVVAGKGHETVQEIGDQRLRFDDRAVVREFLAHCELEEDRLHAAH